MADNDRPLDQDDPGEAEKKRRTPTTRKKAALKKKVAKKISTKTATTTKTSNKKAVKRTARPAASESSADTALVGHEEVQSPLEQMERPAVNETSATPAKKIEAPKIETKTAMLLWVVIAVVCLFLIDALSPGKPEKSEKTEKAVEPAVSTQQQQSQPMVKETLQPPKRAEGSPPGYWLYVPQGGEQTTGKQDGAWRYIPYGSEIAL